MKEILIVEDENIIALDLKHRLQKMGYEILNIASSGEEAMLFVENKKPDLIIMDVKLKGEMDGVNIAQKIYEKFYIPIIYVTSYSDDNTINRIKETRCGHLIKPVNEYELKEKIETLFNPLISSSMD